MRYVILLLCFTVLTAAGYSQDVTLTTQAQVDAFNQTVVDGNLMIRDDGTNPITNLDGLSGLTSVTGDLTIRDNPALQQIDGLSGLTDLPGWGNYILNNNALTNINGLSNLTDISGSLWVSDNNALTNIDGLSNLTDISGSLIIHGNFDLTSIDALSSLTDISGELTIKYNAALTNIDGLSNLTDISGRLTIESIDALTNIDGLSNLTDISGLLRIEWNRALTDCCGIQPLLSNPALSGGVLVRYNSFPCNSAQEVFNDTSCLDQGIVGTVRYAADGSCDSLDLNFDQYRLDVHIGGSNLIRYPSSDGLFGIYSTSNRDYTLTPIIDLHPELFSVAPDSVMVVTYPDSVVHVDFCVTPDSLFSDLSIFSFALEQARPGFEASYRLCYENLGTIIEDGQLSWTFDETLMEVVNTSVPVSESMGGTLLWDFSDLAPFERRCIDITVVMNTPMDDPALNGGDMLCFISVIESDDQQAGDINLEDNNHKLIQTVVNSYDPNDKTCLNGDNLYIDAFAGYVDYMIRFENTGTAEATFVTVIDTIDTTYLDVSSIILLETSHKCQMSIADGHIVTFRFDDIQLGYEDDVNDGFIVFRIRTKDDFELGDELKNFVDIYFDFNFPIRTNTATSVLTMPVHTNEVQSGGFKIYPSPVRDLLHITVDRPGQYEIQMHNTLGHRVYQLDGADISSAYPIDVHHLPAGLYSITLIERSGAGHTMTLVKL